MRHVTGDDRRHEIIIINLFDTSPVANVTRHDQSRRSPQDAYAQVQVPSEDAH